MIHPVPCCCDPAPELAMGLAHSSVIFSTTGTPSSGTLRTRAYNRADVGTAVFNSTNYVIYDVDSLGNMYQVVFTARTSIAKRSSAGTSVWTHAAAGSSLYSRLCVNRNFDVFTTQGDLATDAAITDVEKINSSGTQQWITRVSGSHGIFTREIACDRDGNSFACGQQIVPQAVTGGSGTTDINGWGAYFDGSGNEIWTVDALADIHGSTDLTDLPDDQTSLGAPCFDSEGNVYFGFSQMLNGTDNVGTTNFAHSIFKFDSLGTEVWRKAITALPFHCTVSGMAIDGNGNLYVAYSGRDSAGNVIGLGLRRYNGPDQSTVAWDFELNTSNDTAALAVNQFGDLFVFNNTDPTNKHHRIRASDGTVLQSAAGAGASSGNVGLVSYPGRAPNFQ